METQTPFQYISLAVTVIYLFSFRESVTRTALWGAFEFECPKLLSNKIPFSAIVLILIPVFAYFQILAIIAKLDSWLVNLSMPIIRALIISTAILYLGLFPRFGKHLWCFIVKKKTDKGVDMKEIGWLNRGVDIKQLPNESYSLKMIIILGIVPLISIVLLMTILGTAKNFINRQLLFKIYVSLYVSQFFVLYPLSKKRKFYESSHKWLINKRMIYTYSTTILLPVAFGIAVSQLILKLESRIDTFSFTLFVVYLFIAWPFPYYCNQSWLIVTRKESWCTQEECPEIHGEGKGTHWRMCLAFACICIIVLCSLICLEQLNNL